MMPGPADWLLDAPLYQAWSEFVTSEPTPFTIPGHKRRAGLLDPGLGRLLDADVPLYGGADSVKLAAGVLREAEQRAADLWGANLCRFSTGGSTHANEAVCLTLGGPGDEVIVARNAHRSILGGLVLSGLKPVWVAVRTDPATGAPLGPSPTAVAAALAAHPRAVAVLCTEPSYQGTLGDLAGTVDVAHAAGVPVVVDQAWGAHFGFAEGYPPHALQCGADAVVMSAHKALPAFSQAALIVARTERLDGDRLERAVDTTGTTSPSASILASIDAGRALLGSAAGRSYLARTAGVVARARRRLRSAGLVAPGPEDFPDGCFDPAKLVVHFSAYGGSGLVAEDLLVERGLPVEMADRDVLVAHVGLTDDQDTLDPLVGTILESQAGARGSPRTLAVATADLPPQAMTPRDAFFAAYRPVPASESLGLTCAELIAPYPPGVPLLVPGERITRGTLSALAESRRAGNRIAYAADPTLRTVHVVDGDVR